MVSGAGNLHHCIDLSVLPDQAYLDAIAKELSLNAHRSPVLFAAT